MSIKHVVTAVAGLALGAAAGAGLLYVNPLTAAPPAETGAFDRVLRYGFPSDDVLVLTHAGNVPMIARPAGVQELWESSIRSTVAGLVAMRESEGPAVAAASKITVPSARTDLLGAGVVVDDNWLLTVPGQGSLLVLGHSNVWPAIKENLLPGLLGRPWTGPRSYRTTEGPGLRGTALVVGATGRFEAQHGSAVERFELDAFSRDGGFEKFTGELRLRLVSEDPEDAVEETVGSATHE